MGVVNLTLRGFCSNKMEDMGLKSHQWMCWSKAWCSQPKSLLNSLFAAQESIAGVTAHSSESMLEFYCSQLSSITKVDFIYPAMEYFPKSLIFWKVESSALAIQLKAKGEPLPRKISTNLSLRGPQHELSGRKWTRNSNEWCINFKAADYVFL